MNAYKHRGESEPSGLPGAPAPGGGIAGTRYGRYMGVLAALALVGIVAITLFGSKIDVKGIAPGARTPPFAAPLALGSLPGDVNVATHAGQGQAGDRPACSVRGAQILNVCQLYERGPVVLALFIDNSSCIGVLREMQALAPAFPQVRFAAVAIKGETRAVRGLVRREGLSFPVGLDRDGILVELYKLATCPQVSFLYPGGVVQSAAMLSTPPPALLHARVAALLADARARGWRPST
ncbi:MAG: TlpA family protein disulfide reductase [Solirubrobacteraceae bacterium]